MGGSVSCFTETFQTQRLHLVECIASEKAYMASNGYLKFSELVVLNKDEQPFSNTYGGTSVAVLTEFFWMILLICLLRIL